MTIVLERRRFLLAVLGAGLAIRRAHALPYCVIPPAPASCYAECKNSTVLNTTCDRPANFCRSTCDVYHPGQVPAQVLDGLTSRSQEGKKPITKEQLQQAIDEAKDALAGFLTEAMRLTEPGFYWALFLAPLDEPPRFLDVKRAEVSPPPFRNSKDPQLAVGFTAASEDIKAFQTGDISKMVSDAESAVINAHFGLPPRERLQ